MYKLQIIHKCYICGNKTVHNSLVCIDCRTGSPLISGSVCSVCGIPILSEESICIRCRTNEYSFDRNISLFQYKNVARDIFYQYKFKKHREIGLWYCSLLSDIIKKEFPGFIVVPSPYRYFKKIRKGWDQVEFISNHLKKRHHIPIVSLLKRSSGTDQKKLNYDGRKNNLKGNITVKKNMNIDGKQVLFLDDIFTTGATADECARILKQKGASEVAVLTIAID